MTQPMALEDPCWREKALTVIETYVQHGRTFTTDDLHQIVGEPPHPNWWGAVILAARSRHLITRTGYQPSTRPSRRHGVVAVWSPHPNTHQPR